MFISTFQNYTLDVISHHPQFKNKKLCKYHVDGVESIGAWGDEEFEIKFTNHTFQKVQIKISIDGTDVLSGGLADTNVSDKMWVVNGNSSLSLTAWLENHEGGAKFIFSSVNNSVAFNTHRDLSHCGIIAVAVFVEGHVESVRLLPFTYTPTPWAITYTNGFPITVDANIMNQDNRLNSSILRTNSNCSTAKTEQANFMECAAVGAGQYTDQKISHASGLIKPIFSESVKIRYYWWDNLLAKLTENKTVPVQQPSGFPGDKPLINLGKTPRIGDFGKAFPREKQVSAPSYARAF